MTRIELNDEAIAAQLQEVGRRISDPSPLMADLAELLLVSTQDRLAKGVQPDGQPFAPRSPTTLKRYAKLGIPFGPPLTARGDMARGIHSASESDYASIGSNAIQARVMHFGARKGQFGTRQGKGFGGSSPTISLPWGDIPARPFIGISEQDRSNILEELAEYLAGVPAGD